MTHEDFVTYDQAVKLKELGFDWDCIAQWAAEPDGNPCLMWTTVFAFRNSECKGKDACAPTLAQAAKWMRKEKGLVMFCIPNISRGDFSGEWFCDLWISDKKYSIVSDKTYISYELALSAGVNLALDILEWK